MGYERKTKDLQIEPKFRTFVPFMKNNGGKGLTA